MDYEQLYSELLQEHIKLKALYEAPIEPSFITKGRQLLLTDDNPSNERYTKKICDCGAPILKKEHKKCRICDN